MNKITVVIANTNSGYTAANLAQLTSHSMIERVLWLRLPDAPPLSPDLNEQVQEIVVDALFSSAALQQVLEACETPYALLILPGGAIDLGYRALERFVQAAEDAQAVWVYSDYRDQNGSEITDHPTIDYQIGSIRDTFDFGGVVLFDVNAAERSLFLETDETAIWQWGALYDLRLRLSEEYSIIRIPEPLYTRHPFDVRATGEKLFDYVDPRQRAYQIEMERIATAHLQRSGAWLAPHFDPLPIPTTQFPLTASVIIPVRNRAKTVSAAVQSARAQKTAFPFNVIVVDNHSTDGTTEILSTLAADNESELAPLIHLKPVRTDLGIGGCWNEALYSSHCGRIAVQLDSDDIYANEAVLARIVAEFALNEAGQSRYAMVIGSYTIVDFDLQELPPGLIDHREWTRDNGRNNALRINGLGAPRAFDVAILREIGLPNTSYGEDYAVALRLSRQYELGRIYDSLYYARRWSGNSDSALPLATANRYDVYKDWLRSQEIAARQAMHDAQDADHAENE